jgi:hypothetical protein
MARPVVFRLPTKQVTEIRVHGVGGTPPPDMLDQSDLVQVSGDHRAGFFRRATESDPARHVEAYSWGGLTSRSALRSMWLLLLPFTLANVAGWMVESDTSAPRGNRQWHAEIQERAIRVISVLLTVNFVAWIAAITVDLVAYQCGGAAACRADHWWLEVLGRKVFEDRPQLRIFVGLAVALGIYALIDYLAKRVRSAYDEYPRDVAQRPQQGAADPASRKEAGDQAKLESPLFWNRPTLVKDLAFLHRACVLFTMLCATALTLVPFETGVTETGFRVLAVLSGIAAGVVALSAAALRRKRRQEELSRSSKLPNYLIAALGVGFVGMLLLVALGDPSRSGLPLRLVHFRRLPVLILLVQFLLIVFFVVGPQLYWWVKGLRVRDPRAEATARGKFSAASLLFLSVLFLVFRSPWIAVAAAVLGAVIVFLGGRRFVLFVTFGLALVIVSLIRLLWDSWEPSFVALAVLIAVWWATATEKDWEPNAFRWGPVAVLPVLGSLLLAGVMVGIAIRLVDFLDKERSVSALRELMVPPAYEWFSIAFASALILTALAALVLHFQIRRDVRSENIPYPQWGHPDMPDVATPLTGKYLGEAESGIRGSRALVKTARAGDIFLTWLCSITLIIFLFGLFVAASSDETTVRFTLPWLSQWTWLEAVPTGFARLFTDSYPFSQLEWLRTMSSWVLALLPLALVYALRRGTQDESLRRKIGIVWDLGTFWPRRFHPLTPPSYSERAVPELQQRLDYALRDPKARVALLAHSQGSVVAIAALAPRPAEQVNRISLVTYGSPLRTYYERFFPTYFTEELFKNVKRKLGQDAPPGVRRWKNFYRWTDPIAAPIFTTGYNDPPTPAEDTTPAEEATPAPQPSQEVDQALKDPWWWWDIPGEPVPKPLVHSNYLDDRQMRDWVEGL